MTRESRPLLRGVARRETQTTLTTLEESVAIGQEAPQKAVMKRGDRGRRTLMRWVGACERRPEEETAQPRPATQSRW